MDKILVLAGTSFQETLRRRIFYVVLALLLLIVAMIGAEMGFLHMATEAGETETVGRMQTQFVASTANIWNFAALVLAVFLGSVAVSSEIARKTIANVLARPVERVAYLLGRWLGILVFLWAFQLVGVGLALVIGRCFHVPWSPMGWIAIADALASVWFYSGVALALGAVTPPVVAGILTILLRMAPSLAEGLAHHPRWYLRAVYEVPFYLSPAGLPLDPVSETLTKESLHPAYGLCFQVLGENALYTAAAVLICCAIFSRRELRLR